jgi:hypothetical protein
VIALGCGVLLLGILFYVFYPERHVEAQRQKTRLEYLCERKDVLYDNLRDLNFEYRAGKYVDEDFRAQQRILEDEAAGVLAEIEFLESTGPLGSAQGKLSGGPPSARP